MAEAIADRSQRTVVTADALANLSNSARGLGKLELAAAHAEEALRRYAGQGVELAELRTVESLGHIARDQGRYPLAVERYQRCLERTGEDGEKRLIAANLEGIATVATAWRQPRTALLLFGAAAAVREEAGVQMRLPVDSARVAGDLAASQAAMDDQEFANTLAEGRALPMTDAIALAVSISQSGSGQVSTAAGPERNLTRRERDIVRLLSQSLTDREIGEALFLSPRTVNWHMRSILAKLGVTSRRDVAIRDRGDGLL